MRVKNIIFDFDGVIIDSMPIRSSGFRTIFSKFNPEDVDKLIVYHNQNGGLSRYVKIRYFFETILQEAISDDEIKSYADFFSVLMIQKLTNRALLIDDSVSFIKKYHDKYDMHIASGSDEQELNELCRLLDIQSHFITICGSPTKKSDLVRNIISSHGYKSSETVLVGDSINDYHAAKDNSIIFYGFNNLDLKELSDHYLVNYDRLCFDARFI